MGKIYTSMEDYEKAFEDDFKAKVEEIAYYQGSRERTTLDGEWTESELKDDITDEAGKILTGWLEKNSERAMYDRDLVYVEYLVNKIVDENDIIELYNKEYDKHRNDSPRKFGIFYFDTVIIKMINKILKDNLITGR